MTPHSEEVNRAREQIASDFRSLATHAEELLQATTSMSGDTVKAAREQLQDSLRQARVHLDDAHGYAMQRTREAVASTIGYVRERPWQSLAIAVLAGLAVGVASGLSSRRSDSGR